MKLIITSNRYVHNVSLLYTNLNGSIMYLWLPLSCSINHDNIYKAI